MEQIDYTSDLWRSRIVDWLWRKKFGHSNMKLVDRVPPNDNVCWRFCRRAVQRLSAYIVLTNMLYEEEELSLLQRHIWLGLGSLIYLLPAALFIAAFAWTIPVAMIWPSLIKFTALTPYPSAALSAVVIVAGLAAFWLRANYRAFYGGSEMMFVLFVINQIVSERETLNFHPFAESLAVLGALFVFIQGIESVQSGWQQNANSLKSIFSSDNLTVSMEYL
jgi:hypothetical protein